MFASSLVLSLNHATYTELKARETDPISNVANHLEPLNNPENWDGKPTAEKLKTKKRYRNPKQPNIASEPRKKSRMEAENSIIRF